MVRSHTTVRRAACTAILALAGAWAVPVAAQETAAAGAEADEDCDPQPLAYRGNDFRMLLARTSLNRPQPALGVRPAAPEAAPAAPATPGPAPANRHAWEISMGDKTLNATMARWAATAGWQLLWELPIDYAVEARTQVHGTFEEAVGLVASSMETAEIPMKAVFYQGNKVLRIMAKGSE